MAVISLTNARTQPEDLLLRRLEAAGGRPIQGLTKQLTFRGPRRNFAAGELAEIGFYASRFAAPLSFAHSEPVADPMLRTALAALR